MNLHHKLNVSIGIALLALAAGACSGSHPAPSAIAAPAASDSTAQASAPPAEAPAKTKEAGEPRPECFNVVCSFVRKEGGDGARCEAAASFTHLVADDGGEIPGDSHEPLNPRFEVGCDQQYLYNSSAHRYTDEQGTRLQALEGPFPAVVLPPGALREGHRYEKAALELGGGEILDGSCYVYTGPAFEVSDNLVIPKASSLR